MNISKLSFDYTTQKKFIFGLMSDIHLDAKGHDKAQFDSDMSSLCGENARMTFNGDTFDVILPTDRKRYSRSGDISAQDSQINDKVNYGFNRLKPYADYIDYFGYGNHEISVIKYNNVDPLYMLIEKLNAVRSKTLPQIKRGGYVGLVYLHFHRNNESVKRFVIARDHGKGGSSPVTKGMIQLQRMYATYDADLYQLGHVHTSVIDNKSQHTMGVSPQGKFYDRYKIGLIVPGYNRCFEETSYEDDEPYRLNYPEESFISPTGIGYGRLEVELTSEDIRSRVSIE